MLTIGTAGHIDHGKSSLIKALTSMDPDRLPEEKERGMTIDLGFAWLALPSGETIGIVDVPGHKQFIHNVIPGLFGIDAVMLVVAADDGWMPQSEEHLRILDLLGIKHGIIVLNKVDLISDPEWLSLVENDIATRLAGTSLEGSPIIKVSARSGQGIAELVKAIAGLAEKLTPRQDIGKPRLPIDRVFIIKGSGVVVTGTMSHGSISEGDDVIIMPSGQNAHVRNLESFKKESGKAEPGTRTALNLAGIKREDIKRGDIVVSSAAYAPLSRFINTSLTLLADAGTSLKNMSEVLVYMETRELLARVALFGEKTLKPGETCAAQLRFKEDVVAFTGERFIIRQQSPAKTTGGGVVLNPHSSRFKTTEAAVAIALLDRRRSLNLDELILAELEQNRFVEEKTLLAASFFPQSKIREHLKQLISQNKLVLAGLYAVNSNVWEKASLRLLSMIEKETAADKLKGGVSQDILKTALGLPREIFDTLAQQMISAGKLIRQEDLLMLPQSKPSLSPQQDTLRTAVLNLFAQNPSAPPTLKDVAAQLPAAQPVVRFMIKQGELVELPDGILLEADQFKRIQDEVINILKQNGKIAIQDINKQFGFSRKYAIPLLTKFDILGITRREGDARVAGKKLG
jgi:selenocysteine-specific elongation factor